MSVKSLGMIPRQSILKKISLKFFFFYIKANFNNHNIV